MLGEDALPPFGVGNHGIFVKGWVWVDLVRDASGKVYVQGREGVCKLGIDLIDDDMKDGM